MRFSAPLAALLLVIAPASLLAQTAPTPDLARLTDDHRAALRCSALFAIIASEQARGVESALRLAPLDHRGREYFVATGARVIDEAGLTREAVARLMEDDVARFQQAAMASDDPDAVIGAEMLRCQPLLDAAVPPLEQPSLLQCAALLGMAAQEVEAREGLSPAAMDLKTLATVLDSRARRELIGAGRSNNESDVILGTARDELLAAEAAGGAAGDVGRWDFEHCYNLAAPEPDPHSPHQ